MQGSQFASHWKNSHGFLTEPPDENMVPWSTDKENVPKFCDPCDEEYHAGLR